MLILILYDTAASVKACKTYLHSVRTHVHNCIWLGAAVIMKGKTAVPAEPVLEIQRSLRHLSICDAPPHLS